MTTVVPIKFLDRMWYVHAVVLWHRRVGAQQYRMSQGTLYSELTGLSCMSNDPLHFECQVCVQVYRDLLTSRRERRGQSKLWKSPCASVGNYTLYTY